MLFSFSVSRSVCSTEPVFLMSLLVSLALSYTHCTVNNCMFLHINQPESPCPSNDVLSHCHVMLLLSLQPGGNRSGQLTPGTAPGVMMNPNLARRCWSVWAGPKARSVLRYICNVSSWSTAIVISLDIGSKCMNWSTMVSFSFPVKGLGRTEQGSTEHIKVKVKNNSYGLGTSVSHEVSISST